MTATTARHSSSSTAELARQGDLNKYYQPWIDSSKKLPAVPPDALPRGDDDRQTPSSSSPSSSSSSSHDTTLTAFAQLAALRLNAKRGLVSLIGTSSQIILAEATQTLSLVDERRHAPGDDVWLGNVAVPREDCMDEHVLGSVTTVVCEDDCRGETRTRAIPALVVRDAREDERFAHRPYVAGGVGVRFYAGVPIVTRQGHAIGVYAVSGSQPRPQGLSYDELRFMQDVAQIIAEHLERVMFTVGRGSDRDFMRGISNFLEELSEFKHNLSNANRSQGRCSGGKSGKSDVQATDPQDPPPPRPKAARRDSSTSASSSLSSTRDGPEQIPEGDLDHVPRYSNDSTSRGTEVSNTAKANVDKVFTLASELLCEQAGASGCLFLDAASGLFTNKVEESSTAPLSMEASTTRSSSVERSDNERLDPNGITSADGAPLSRTPSNSQLDELAGILSLNLAEEGSRAAFDGGVIRRKALKECILRYPYGECFYLNKGRDLDGGHSDGHPNREEIVTGGGPGQKDRDPNSSPANGDNQPHMPLPKELLDLIPEAQWVVFLPLFDYARGHWSAAGFIWGDGFQMGDPEGAFPFFKTFGSCMMNEIASMEVLNTDIAKSTLIASISHELRSPLHGMLGSLEFLEDTMTSAYQMSLLGAIETCGKTLLDTIDHLLEYAKINSLNRAGAKAGSPMRENGPKGSSEVIFASQNTAAWSCFDLATLFEEVVEAVFAGQTFRKINLRHRDPVDDVSTYIKSMSVDDSETAEDHIHAGSAKFSGRVFFILNIEKSAHLCLQGQTGALRRVIMNVVGNAIKYCNQGCIETSLKAKELSASDVEVEISVKDTGIGMSRDFLANYLFKAFAQEDPFASGTGLGLSITYQIVKSMDGEIHVDSEKGVGTHIRITIPMKVASPTSAPATQENLLLEALKVTSGTTISFLNPTPRLDGDVARKWTKLEDSIATFCHEWLEASVIESVSVESAPDTSVFIYAEPPPIENLVENHRERKANGKSGKKAALLIICTNTFEAAACAQVFNTIGRVVEVISQPVGVRKFARVLLQCLQRVEAISMDPLQLQDDDFDAPSFKSSSIQARATRIGWNTMPVVYEPAETKHRPSIESLKWRSEPPWLKVPADGNGQSDPASPDELSQSAQNRTASSPSWQQTETPPPPPRTPTTAASASASASRVLLVDDNAINLKLLKTFTKKLGLPSTEAVNGQEAVARFREAGRDGPPFDYVLMDLQMPIMDGLEATRRIREYEQQQEQEQGQRRRPATIIAITGVGSEDTYRQAMDAGMSRFLTKPVKFKTLQGLLVPPPDPDPDPEMMEEVKGQEKGQEQWREKEREKEKEKVVEEGK
ncbi:hypothetical protein GGR56DRAFT_675318 [Xylariaceae sp. FL0804]|nr:hypothetical protein GGR56DRAFT_675318 [Xylariaceae sp. FL0804]